MFPFLSPGNHFFPNSNYLCPAPAPVHNRYLPVFSTLCKEGITHYVLFHVRLHSLSVFQSLVQIASGTNSFLLQLSVILCDANKAQFTYSLADTQTASKFRGRPVSDRVYTQNPALDLWGAFLSQTSPLFLLLAPLPCSWRGSSQLPDSSSQVKTADHPRGACSQRTPSTWETHPRPRQTSFYFYLFARQCSHTFICCPEMAVTTCGTICPTGATTPFLVILTPYYS